MIRIPCPWCGPRDATEFAYAGDVMRRPDPATASPEQWRGYLYMRENQPDWATERWYHRMGCRQYVTVRRHRTTNQVKPS